MVTVNVFVHSLMMFRETPSYSTDRATIHIYGLFYYYEQQSVRRGLVLL